MNKAIPLLIIIALLAALAAGCNRRTHEHYLLANIDSLITANKDSLALSALENINSAELNGDDMAYYNLLKVRTMYKLSIPIKDDSLINICIDHYKNNGDNKMLAEAYFYKSTTNHDRHNVNAAITYMKMAEEAANNTNDENTKYKIYEKLDMYNSSANEYDLSIYYGKKALEIAKKNWQQQLHSLRLCELSHFTNVEREYRQRPSLHNKVPALYKIHEKTRPCLCV